MNSFLRFFMGVDFLLDCIPAPLCVTRTRLRVLQCFTSCSFKEIIRFLPSTHTPRPVSIQYIMRRDMIQTASALFGMSRPKIPSSCIYLKQPLKTSSSVHVGNLHCQGVRCFFNGKREYKIMQGYECNYINMYARIIIP